MKGGEGVSAEERRAEIYEVLLAKGKTTVNALAEQFGVNERTIRRDIEALALTRPVETIQGRYGGGVKLADWYHPQRTRLCPEQMKLLRKLAPFLGIDDLAVLNSIIDQFAP